MADLKVVCRKRVRQPAFLAGFVSPISRSGLEARSRSSRVVESKFSLEFVDIVLSSNLRLGKNIDDSITVFKFVDAEEFGVPAVISLLYYDLGVLRPENSSIG